MLKPGSQVPDLQLPTDDGGTFSFTDQVGRGSLLVLFFPLAFTSTCTEEMCAVGDDLRSYGELRAQVVAVSVDSPFVLARFRRECRAEFPFLSDFHREAAEAFGVLRPEPLGPGLRYTADRAAFVVDPAGEIVYAWTSKNPGVLPPFEEIRAVLSEVRERAA